MKLCFAALTFASFAAFAEPPTGDRDEIRDKVEHRMHLMRLIELTERLGLSDDKAMQLSKMMEQFDQRRRTLGDSTREARAIVKRAADGDASAQKQLDQAVDQLIQARKAMNDVDADQYRAISKELTPAQRAKFVLFLGEFRHRMEGIARDVRDQRGRDSDARP